jgi:hypothetical protein
MAAPTLLSMGFVSWGLVDGIDVFFVLKNPLFEEYFSLIQKNTNPCLQKLIYWDHKTKHDPNLFI